MYALSCFILKETLPCLPVRNRQNEIKTVSVGGTPRVRVPSQSLKRPMREDMSEDEVIFENGSDLVHLYLEPHIINGTFVSREDTAYVNLATALCDALNTRYRPYGVTKSDEKGSLVSYDRKTLPAIFEAVMQVYTDNAADFKKKTLPKDIKTKVQNAAKDAYYQYATNPVQALLGKMSTGGAADTYYGALRMGDAISVDVHAGDREDFVARMLCKEAPNANSFFDGILNNWSAKERAKPNADTMNSFDIASNTFALPAVIDARLLYKNLSLHNATAKPEEVRPPEMARKMTKDISLECLRDLMLVQHVGKQRSNMSFTRPSLVVIGVYKKGQPVFPTFPKPLAYDGLRDKSVTEQAIERTLQFLQDETFAFDDVQYYVMLAEEYSEYAEQFKALGATLIKARDFNSALGAEIDGLVDAFTTI